ncbi:MULTISPECIES: hypothetical protein [Paenibacillus]|jgi:hypothetical protein|uniref:hypothetical protein n=1 Tax=Paenibacillus TaxID=44249 RepID=UPI0004F67E8D|nr:MULTISPECIES: hypothetical protein [unclassified Paenibacillus]AIQ28487.1 hypothetical protein P40081_10085 [Paenibacillus sp. FSL P4-0081]AIQ40227.1 hypothetical protein R50912_09445 [Paenibacillus sp. FSL R5-0912]OMF33301.1 hypothetical protein BK132_03570 [Paenibacillus sp. FSL H8-0259]
MDKSKKYMLAGAILTAAGVSLMTYTANRYTSFKKVVARTIRLEDIASLEITRLSSVPGEQKDIVVTEPEAIKQICDDFADVRLMKSARNVSTDNKYSYYITIVQADRKQRFDIILKGRQHMIIYDNDMNNPHLKAYKIMGSFHPQALNLAFA